MAEWKNLDTLKAYKTLMESDHRVDIKKALSGDAGAERVKNELINMGVKPEKITTAHFGGVEILTPIDFNRRATVQITEE